MLGGSMQPDRPALARAWLATAVRDLRVADRIRDEEPSLACFHAQQAAEKALRCVAVLAIGDVAFAHALPHIVPDWTAAGVTVPARVVRALSRCDRRRETFALGTVVIDFAREAMQTGS